MSQHIEWLNLIDRSGAFLEPGVLDDALPQGLEGVDSERRRNLLSAYDEWREAVDACDADAGALHRAWLDFVLKEFLEYEDRVLLRGESVPEALSLPVAEHGGRVRPGMAVMKGDSPQLLIDVLPPDTDLESIRSYEGWNTSALDRMIALCRGAKVTIGLVTNGERWLVVHVPEGGTVGHASWYGRIWRPEPVTLRAFQTLLGVRRCFGPQDKTLPALLSASLEYQDEVTDTLGQQVRRAVEVLIQSLDRADHDRHGELLMDVEPRELYEAGLTVMMRLVFLLCAEERGLLLLGEGIYDQNYAISTLRSELREWQSRHGDQVLERRHDAWSRLLATFRAVFGGVAHETLRMPALGGSLFDPDRFPFLEGRPKGSSWRQSVAAPLPIDNRTVLLLLSSLQVLEQRRGARLLSYKALDVEQVGHVYEGLLERTVQRLPEITLGLEGASSAKDPNVSLVDLERAQREGEASLLAILGETTGRSHSLLRRSMGRELDEASESLLLMACGSDTGLLKRVKPWANLLRKDIWDHPLVYRKNAFAVTLGSDRRETGTHYTPKSLTERVVRTTLEPLVYVGPSAEKPRETWKLRAPHELLDLKVCDPAMGSGAFLVQVCRYLGDRLAESWSIEEASGKAITVDGEVLENLGSSEPMPIDPGERAILARRMVAERCLYGVDINPMAVELAKLSIWLVTLAKGRPFGFLDHNFKCGDSLFGIHRLDQVIRLMIDPTKPAHPKLFGRDIDTILSEVIDLRIKLRSTTINNINDIKIMEQLDINAKNRLKPIEYIADKLINVSLYDDRKIIEKELADLSVLADDIIGNNNIEILSTNDYIKEVRQPKEPRRPFHWPIEFPEVFIASLTGFDAIVGNPPYVFGELRPKISNSIYKLATGQWDLCWLFIERAAQIVNTKLSGFGYVLPDSILAREDPQKVRNFVVDRFDNISIYHAGTMFKASVSVFALCSHVGEWARKSIKFESKNGEVSYKTIETHKCDIKWSHSGLNNKIDKMSFLNKLGDYVKISRGEEIGKSGLSTYNSGYNSATQIAVVAGAGVRDILCQPITTHVMNIADVSKNSSIYTAPKIISVKTGVNIKAGIDRIGHTTLQSAYNIHLLNNNNFTIEFICALITCKVVNSMFIETTTTTKGVFPQITQNMIKEIPIPQFNQDDIGAITKLVMEYEIKKNTEIIESINAVFEKYYIINK